MKVEVKLLASSQEEINELAEFLKGLGVAPAIPDQPVTTEASVENKTEEKVTEVEEKVTETVTLEEIRALATSLIRANLQPEVKEILNGVGATSISKIPGDKINEVFESLKNISLEALK